jgi:myb proto-oncogene protein
VQIENPTSESMFYKPPHLPSLDFPFVSFDLINSYNHIQQEYSPLGVLQMIMSSVTSGKIPIRILGY